MRIAEIEALLADDPERARLDSAVLAAALSAAKSEAVTRSDENAAKHVWCLEQVLKIRVGYEQSFAELKRGEYYSGWCTLAQVELALHFLSPHFRSSFQRYHLGQVERWVTQWQTLFPYGIFLSPEIIEHEKLCSICNSPIRIRSRCPHRVGEIYGGELCVRIVTKPEIIGLALVKTPVQKYSVPFMTDPKTKGQVDHYDYFLVRSAITRLLGPYEDWRFTRTTRRHPHSRYKHVGPNAPCPCESGRKYKKCCLKESGVLRPHIEFEFSHPLPSELAQIEYSRA